MTTIVIGNTRTLVYALGSKLPSGIVQALDLTGASVNAIVGQEGNPVPVVDKAAAIVDAKRGIVQVTLGPADLITEPGQYSLQWRVTFGDLTVRTLPDQGPECLTFRDTLD